MVSTLEWPALAADTDPVETIIRLSHFYGSDPEFVLAGGGNTSVKVGDTLRVKASGYPLATIPAEGFVALDRVALGKILESDYGQDVNAREESFKQAIMAARLEPQKGQRPSVESVLHHLMPGRYVIHTHCTLVNMITCSTRGEALAGELFGDGILWMPYIDPGYVLAQALGKALADYAARTHQACPRAVLMQNHGLIVCGDTAQAIRENTDWVVSRVRARLEQTSAQNVFGPATRLEPARAKALINTIGPALRALLAQGDALKIVTFDDGPEALSLAGAAEGQAVAAGGPVTPDQIVYCKSFPLWFEPREGEAPEALVARLAAALKAHEAATRFAAKEVLVAGLGLFTIGDDYKTAKTIQEVYLDAIKIMAGARRLGGILYMTQRNRDFIDNWEVENYRRQIAASGRQAGRAAGKVAVVTGGAQGFGLEIARDLAAQGAHVALLDINSAGAQKAADEIAAQLGSGKAFGLAVNVTDGASVAEAIHHTVRLYGGLDLLVSNAGVLRAGSVKTLSEKDFDFTTAVNYKGYFLCVREAAPVMAIQHKARPGLWSDIIQINSKSGLAGSNKNGAYAGSKFGGIGLTQSFALELVADGIKVNSICPGNFFDGPLWSDPESGLFVQYLRTGKVPGAKTIAEVKRFYEAKVPMGRGCTTPDVMKTIYYLMEQCYETGQAVPVTGGQVMLS